MKRPDDAVTRPVSPLPSGEMDAYTQPLEDIHTPFLLTSDSRQQEGSGELDLLSESNHTHFLLDSFYSSDLFQTIQNRVGVRPENEDGGGANYSVWVDVPGQEESSFSIYQFYHELVRFFYFFVYNVLTHV